MKMKSKKGEEKGEGKVKVWDSDLHLLSHFLHLFEKMDFIKMKNCL